MVAVVREPNSRLISKVALFEVRTLFRLPRKSHLNAPKPVREAW